MSWYVSFVVSFFKKKLQHSNTVFVLQAKQHIRHLGGGRGVPEVDCKDEMLYRFEFPERPGALLRFVAKLPTEWTITLFHYR